MALQASCYEAGLHNGASAPGSQRVAYRSKGFPARFEHRRGHQGHYGWFIRPGATAQSLVKLPVLIFRNSLLSQAIVVIRNRSFPGWSADAWWHHRQGRHHSAIAAGHWQY